MPTLTDLTLLRWSLHSTVREPGFVVDEASLEYVDVDQATFQTLATTFAQASPQDAVDLYVTVGGQQTHLFRGVVRDWAWEETPDGTGRAVLVAEDERGRLLDTEIPAGWVCPGVSHNFRDPSASVLGLTFLVVLRRLAALAGLVIDTSGAPDYAVGPDLNPRPGSTVGEVMAALLRAYQQVRMRKVDLIRTGPAAYRLAQRPATLSGGVSVPASAVRLRRYRRSLMPPLENAVVVGAVAPGTEFNTPLPAIAARRCGTSTPFDVVFPEDLTRLEPVRDCQEFSNIDAAGRLTLRTEKCVTRLGDRVLEVSEASEIIAYDALGVPTSTFVTVLEVWAYDGEGRLESVITTREVDAVLHTRSTKTVRYDEHGRIGEEGTVFEAASGSPPVLAVTHAEITHKTPTNGGTLKRVERWAASGTTWTLQGTALEFSPGDARLSDDPEAKWFRVTLDGTVHYIGGQWVYISRYVADNAAIASIRQAALAQANKWLDEVEVEMPADLSVGVHTVLDFGPDTLAGVRRVLVTEVRVTDDGETVLMVVRGEAFTPVSQTATKRGVVETRGGFPSWGDLRGARPDDAVSLLSGMVTRANGDGTAQVYVPEEGVVYPRVALRASANGQVVLPRDRVTIERAGPLLWARP
jgi:hypothetical protein